MSQGPSPQKWGIGICGVGTVRARPLTLVAASSSESSTVSMSSVRIRFIESTWARSCLRNAINSNRDECPETGRGNYKQW